MKQWWIAKIPYGYWLSVIISVENSDEMRFILVLHLFLELKKKSFKVRWKKNLKKWKVMLKNELMKKNKNLKSTESLKAKFVKTF